MKLSIPGGWRRRRERYLLEGSHCLTCNSYFFPRREVCPNCRRKGKIEDKVLKPEGKIVSFTVVSSAPSGFELNVPYVLALVRLADGPTLVGEVVDGDESEVDIGKPVSVVFRKIREDGADGVIHYGYKFVLKE